MTKSEAKKALREGHKLTHVLFEPHEWVRLSPDFDDMPVIEHEDGAILTEKAFWAIRPYSYFDKGWSIVDI